MGSRGLRGLTIDIFEGDDVAPVLSHTAWAPTLKQARTILQVHAKYDGFLRAALEGRNFHGIPLRIAERWE